MSQESRRDPSGAIRQNYPTPEPIDVSVNMTTGRLHIVAGDRDHTEVVVRSTDPDRSDDLEAASGTSIDFAGRTLSIRAPKAEGLSGFLGLKRGGSIDVTVELPPGSSLTAAAGAVDVRSDGRLGDVELRVGVSDVRLDRVGSLRVKNGKGQVVLEGSSGDVELESAGDIAIGMVDGDADIKNLNGRTRMGQIDGIVRVQSANGDSTIEEAGSDVTVRSAKGDIRIGQATPGELVLETAHGDIHIGIRDGSAAWIDASTAYGRVRNDLSPTDQPDQKTETIEVRARTGYGDVLITRP